MQRATPNIQRSGRASNGTFRRFESYRFRLTPTHTPERLTWHLFTFPNRQIVFLVIGGDLWTEIVTGCRSSSLLRRTNIHGLRTLLSLFGVVLYVVAFLQRPEAARLNRRLMHK